jgi:hypothetical protein
MLSQHDRRAWLSWTCPPLPARRLQRDPLAAGRSCCRGSLTGRFAGTPGSLHPSFLPSRDWRMEEEPWGRVGYIFSRHDPREKTGTDWHIHADILSPNGIMLWHLPCPVRPVPCNSLIRFFGRLFFFLPTEYYYFFKENVASTNTRQFCQRFANQAAKLWSRNGLLPFIFFRFGE